IELPLPLLAVQQPVSLEFSRDGRVLVARWSSLITRHVGIWDLSTAPPEDISTRLFDLPYQAPLYAEPNVAYRGCPVFTPDGSGVLADIRPHGHLRLLDADRLALRVTFDLLQGATDYMPPVFSPDGRLLATTVSYMGWHLPSDLSECVNLVRTR